MRNTAIILASMALVITGCSDKDDAATQAEKAAESESAIVTEEVDVVTESAAGDAAVVVEEVAEEVEIDHAGQEEEELRTEE